MVRSGGVAGTGLAMLLLAQAAGLSQSLAQGYGGYVVPDDDRGPRYERPDDRPLPPRYERRDDPDERPRYERRADPDDDRPRYRRPPDADGDRPPQRLVCVVDDDPDRRCRTRPGRPGSPCRCPGGLEGHREPVD